MSRSSLGIGARFASGSEFRNPAALAREYVYIISPDLQSHVQDQTNRHRSASLVAQRADLFSQGAQVGGAVTASLTPWVAQRYGWTMSFAIAAALALLGATLWMTVHPERPLEIDRKSVV